MYPCACSQSDSHHKTAGQKLRAEHAGPWSESSGAPRTRSSLSRATPPHARYRARRQGAGSHRRAAASGARASAAAPPPPAAAAASPGSAKNMSAPRGKIAPGRQSTPNEKPHALGRWGPKRPKLAQRTGTRTPGRVSAPLIGSTRWLFFGRAASRGAEMRATLQHCNRTWAPDGLPRSDSSPILRTRTPCIQFVQVS